MKKLISARLALVVACIFGGCGGSDTSSKHFVAAQISNYQVLAPSLEFPANASAGIHTFRSAAEWSQFWNGQPPALPEIDFSNTAVLAVVSVGFSDYEITGMETAISGITVDAIETTGPGTVSLPPPTPGPHGQLVAIPAFSGEAQLTITASYPLP